MVLQFPAPAKDSQIASLLNRVRAYSNETGIPYETCIHEALTLWLNCRAEVDSRFTSLH